MKDEAGSTEILRLASPWRYALGMLGLTIPNFMYMSFGTVFYNKVMGLSLGLIALGNIFFTIWDALNDPLSGYLSDHTRTRYGRRRPWLLIAAPLFSIFMICFFSPLKSIPNGPALAVYFTAFLMLTETANTIVFTNYHSLFPELFKNEKDRAYTNGIRQVLQLVGMIVGTAMVPMLADMFGYQAVAIFMAIIGMMIFTYSILGCKEDPDAKESRAPGLRESLSAVIRNRNFWTVSITNFFYQATSGLVLATIAFFALYTLKLDGTQTTILLASVFLSAIPAVVAWSRIVLKIGSLTTWRIALAFFGVSFFPMLFVNSLITAVLGGILVGIGIAGVTATLDLINARIIDEDARVYGLRREGIFISSISFITRFSGLIKSLVFTMVTLLFGFVSDAVPGNQPALACRWMFAGFPLILMVFSVIASLFVRFNSEDNRQEEQAESESVQQPELFSNKK